MQDLTTGPLTRHLLKTASFMLAMMVFQTLYLLVDLYWVGRVGTQAVAAVGIAGNLSFVVLALTQMLGIGTTTVVSHAVGRKDHAGAKLLFNQAQVLGALVGALFLVVALLLRERYAAAMAPDAPTGRMAARYLAWFIPAMALQFPMASMGAAMRGTGHFRPSMVVSIATVMMNMALAPVLIFGWGPAPSMGAAGAAAATLVSIVVGTAWLATYFGAGAYLRFDASCWRPRLALWRRMLSVGLPAGAEFGIMALYLVIVYAVARPFGAAAQAGFGIGMRIIQAGFMPAVALGFAVAPVAGQNFGARLARRVMHTFRDGALMAAGAMALLTIVCQVWADDLVRVFSSDPAAILVGEGYLRIVSWNFIASGVVFVAASMFQAMGNTVPSLATSAARITIVAVPTLLLARRPGFQLPWIWYLTVAGVLVQLMLALHLLRREFARRLDFAPAAESAVA